jgi:hypothetical protein
MVITPVPTFLTSQRAELLLSRFQSPYNALHP